MGVWTDYGIGNDAQKSSVLDPGSIESLDPNPDWGSESRQAKMRTGGPKKKYFATFDQKI